MSRGNDGRNDREISLGDITAARFQDNDDWTFLAFFRVNDIATDDNCIVAKWPGSPSNTNHILIRTDKTASGNSPMEVWMGDALRITGGNNITTGTWYLVGVTNDGGATTLHLFLYDMTGTVLDDDVTGTASNASNRTEPIRFIRRDTSNNDSIDGEIAHVAYFEFQMSQAEIEQYLVTPAMIAANRSITGVQFYLPMGLGSPEPDFSGKGNVGTLIGSPTIEDNPPVAPWYGREYGWRGQSIAAAAAVALAATITDDDTISAGASLVSKIVSTILDDDAVSADASLISKIVSAITDDDIISADASLLSKIVSAITDDDTVSADMKLLASAISTITDDDAVSADLKLLASAISTITDDDSVVANLKLLASVVSTITDDDTISSDAALLSGIVSTITDDDSISAALNLLSKIVSAIADDDTISSDLTITGLVAALAATIRDNDYSSRVTSMSHGRKDTRTSTFIG